MQEPQRQRHLGRVKTGAGLVKFAGALDLEHQVTAVHVLHDEKQPVLRGGGGGGYRFLVGVGLMISVILLQ